jgi:CheY-like chemotaxis protein
VTQRALIADDDALSREFLAETVAAAGYEVRAVADGPAALAALKADDVDLVIRSCGFRGTRARRAPSSCSRRSERSRPRSSR